MIVCNTLAVRASDIVYERCQHRGSHRTPATTSGSRQTLVTGEACRRACQKLLAAAGADVRVSDYSGIAHRQGMESLPGGNSSGTVGTELPEGASVDWKALEGQEFYGEYLAKTDPLGAQDVAESRQPRRLRLRHPCVRAQRRRNDPRDRRGALRRQGDQSALLRGADRGRRHHGASASR